MSDRIGEGGGSENGSEICIGESEVHKGSACMFLQVFTQEIVQQNTYATATLPVSLCWCETGLKSIWEKNTDLGGCFKTKC
jgi:hypothetical protein